MTAKRKKRAKAMQQKKSLPKSHIGRRRFVLLSLVSFLVLSNLPLMNLFFQVSARKESR